MKTENFSLTGASGVWSRNGIIRVLRYDEGDAGGPTPLIRVTSASGSDVDVEMKPGRLITLKEPINGLVIRNLSGASITGKFTWGDGNVEDNTFSGTFDLTLATINALINAKYNTRPEASNGNFQDASTLVANTPLTVFAPGVNTNGAILLSAHCFDAAINLPQVFIAKATPPASTTDGEVVFASTALGATATAYMGGVLPSPQFIAAGKGLYFIGAQGGSVGSTRSARYRLL